jgi:hypothetical protein
LKAKIIADVRCQHTMQFMTWSGTAVV